MRDETTCRTNVQMKRKRNTYLSKLNNIDVKDNYTTTKMNTINEYTDRIFYARCQNFISKLGDILTGDRGRYRRTRSNVMFGDFAGFLLPFRFLSFGHLYLSLFAHFVLSVFMTNKRTHKHQKQIYYVFRLKGTN